MPLRILSISSLNMIRWSIFQQGTGLRPPIGSIKVVSIIAPQDAITCLEDGPWACLMLIRE